MILDKFFLPKFSKCLKYIVVIYKFKLRMQVGR